MLPCAKSYQNIVELIKQYAPEGCMDLYINGREFLVAIFRGIWQKGGKG
jgi:hypothetical protein